MSAELTGRRVNLRPTTPADKRTIFEWATLSDATAAMMGPPLYPDNLPPTWEQFCEDHLPHFFDGSAPELGRSYLIMVNDEAVGQVYYNDIEEYEGVKRTELDIWMRSEKDCGQGYGSEAILLLCQHVFEQLGVTQFMMQPSARNPRAIRAYEKIGFVRQNLTAEEAQAIWGKSDYFDFVYMVKTMPA